MRILLHGFGNFPVVFEQLVNLAPDEDWFIVLNKPNYYKNCCNLLGAKRVLLLKHDFTIPSNHPDCLAEYPFSLSQDLASEKRAIYGKSNIQLESYLFNLFDQIKCFLSENEIDRVVISQVEGADGKALIAAAKALKIQTVVPISCRNLGGTVLCDNDSEWVTLDAHHKVTVPLYTPSQLPPASKRFGPCIERSIAFPVFWPSFYERSKIAVEYLFSGASVFKFDNIRSRFLNMFPRIRDAIWRVNGFLNQAYLNGKYELGFKSLNYVYFPLQYTPESSINTPAPYFVDQFRMIDLIRFNLPPGWLLICKEHPACLPMRKLGFYRRLCRLPAVRIAPCDTPSKELIMHAGLVVSVTGTSVLEAALLGVPAAAIDGLGAAVFGERGLENLLNRVRLVNNPNISLLHASSRIESLIQKKYDFELYAPLKPNDPVLSSSNIRNLYEAIVTDR